MSQGVGPSHCLPRPLGLRLGAGDPGPPAAEALRGKSFGELFGDFFTQMNGRPMTEAEQAALDALMEEVNGG